ncbi:5-methylthioadenosine/S-adenosylhomocysteine deaminase [Desulfolithobacter dissulfuricans]|uniref:5-methylthioadenosine/S-adenosylhomocysteine deaminase n=1 Tax=Desulfolithobacter dissulfuricans TaxID=2795293 RepID=A0A915TXM7_9BACT|nr:amidohydrolase [Desulfolithobacter dissulfuricans]BCO07634.1 5-methylthioadenosine/S-adenosylhomocysteine deaminase [Desulfolithobacter dissulfuricans]
MQTDILITDTLLFPAPGEDTLLPNSFIRIRDSHIVETGPMEALTDQEARTIIDGRGCLAMPGLVNGHCHGAMTLFRGLADDLDLATWLTEHIFPAEARAVTPEMVFWCTTLAAAEMLLAGITTVADGYFHEHEAARAFAGCGIRAVAAQGVIDFPAPGVPDPADNISAAARFLDEWQNHPLVTPAIFAHSPYTCSPETLIRARELARQRNAPFFIHLAETAGEQEQIMDPRGSSPVRHLEALGLLDAMTVCIHCVWVDREDLDILARTGAQVVTCPRSNLKLGSGLAPVTDMLTRDIPVGLGSDSAASNNVLDLFAEMDCLAKIQKIRRRDPVAIPAARILELATTPLLSHRSGPGGRLEPGQVADLILMDLDRPHLRPFYDPNLLVYAARGVVSGT